MKKKGAFTIVELLVVAGLIAILIAVLLPAISRARQQSLQTVCLSNMRQIGLALNMYLIDSKNYPPTQFAGVENFFESDVLPSRASVPAKLVDYLGDNREVFVCPGASDPMSGLESTLTDRNCTNYLGNAIVFRSERKVTQIGKTSSTIAIQEDQFLRKSALLRPAEYGGINVYTQWHSVRMVNGEEEYSSLHMQGGNLLFLDGHAGWTAYRDLRARDFGLTGGPGVNGSPDDDFRTPSANSYLFAELGR